MDIKNLASSLMKKHGIAPAEDPSADDAMPSTQPDPDALDAANDLLDAIHNHDAAGLVSAFQNMNTVASPADDDSPDGGPPQPDEDDQAAS